MPELDGPAVVAVAGPTASGKTRLAVALAQALSAEVVNADSRQAIAELAVGTCKPTPAEMGLVPHHGYDWRHLGEPYSVAEYTDRAVPLVDHLLAQGRSVVVVGGTGLYLRALLRGFDYGEVAPGWRPAPGERPVAAERHQGESAAAELSHLGRLPAGASERANPRRLVRAAELAREGKTARALARPWRIHRIQLHIESQPLRERLRRRARALVGHALVAELEELIGAGYPEKVVATAAIGYAEALAWRGQRCTQEEAIAAVERRTWRYARAQQTWLRGETGASEIDAEADLSLQLRQAGAAFRQDESLIWMDE